MLLHYQWKSRLFVQQRFGFGLENKLVEKRQRDIILSITCPEDQQQVEKIVK